MKFLLALSQLKFKSSDKLARKLPKDYSLVSFAITSLYSLNRDMMYRTTRMHAL